MYKVFYNDRIVFFIDNDLNDLNPDDHKIHYFKGKIQLDKELNAFLKNTEIKSLYVIHHDIELVFREFTKRYNLIEAAGGLVKSSGDELLFIFRRYKWDLPKGKIEKGESPETAAVREVEEECGINNLSIQGSLGVTYHTYSLNGKDILKRTYWYEMMYTGNQKPTPQIEEDITEVKWIKPTDLSEITKNTYPSILEVLDWSKTN